MMDSKDASIVDGKNNRAQSLLGNRVSGMRIEGHPVRSSRERGRS